MGDFYITKIIINKITKNQNNYINKENYMKVNIDFKEKTLQIQGEYTVEEFIDLLDEIPTLKDFKVIPFVEVIIEKVTQPIWDNGNIFQQQPFTNTPPLQPYIGSLEVFCSAESCSDSLPLH